MEGGCQINELKRRFRHDKARYQRLAIALFATTRLPSTIRNGLPCNSQIGVDRMNLIDK